MATYIFGGITAAVLILSIWIGIKNNDAYEQQVKLNARALSILNANQTDLTNLNAKLDKTVSDKDAAIAENVTETAKLDEILKNIESLESDIATQKEVAASNQNKVDDNKEKIKDLPDPDVLIPKITKGKNKIAQLKVDIEADKVTLAELTSNSDSLKTSIEAKVNMNEQLSSGDSLDSLATTIQTVYRSHGFVSLRGGNAQGVVPGSTLDVLRGGEVVAKLMVSAVEQNRSVADILTDDGPLTVSLRSGDQVVAEKKIVQQ